MKKRVLLSGCCGRMGRVIASLIEKSDNLIVTAGVDVTAQCYADFPVYPDFDHVSEPVDVIVDFSNPAVLLSLLAYAKEKRIAAVIATTGLSSEQIEKIHDASEEIPVFFSANMSLGVNVLVALAKKASEILGGEFDIEIIEKHHNQKLDAPSGTALMIANAINSSDRYRYEYDRHARRQARSKTEIGIHSVRGGTIVGQHEVMFAGSDETITITHEATSRNIFACGAVKAAEFISEQSPGLYDMNNLIG